MSIPLHVEMRLLDRDEDDLGDHRVEFGVAGVDAPAGVVISSEMYGNPVIKERIRRGGIDLPDRLLDSLAIACFRVVGSFIVEHDGNSGSWTAVDVTRWIRHHWANDDADQIIRELSRRVTAALDVRDVIVVADDDTI